MSRDYIAANVSRETLQRLDTYADLLTRWNPKINLVAKSTIPELWTRHLLDSVQVAHLAPETYEKWVDIGSGGGFPGLVVAILAAERQPQAHFTLIEIGPEEVRLSAFGGAGMRAEGGYSGQTHRDLHRSRAQMCFLPGR